MDRLSNVLRRRDLNPEIDEELQFHVDSRIRDNIAAGMTDDEARRDALERFGSRARAREETRDVELIVMLETTAQDLIYALRGLRKRPAFTLVALLTLTLGIGANAAIFTIVRSVLLRPLPFPQSGDLYAISYARPGAPFWLYPGMSDSNYLALRERNDWFEATATFASAPLTLTGAGDAVRVIGATVTPDFFRVLRVNPIAGASFATGDDQPGRNHLVMLGDSLWRGRFGADPSVVNRTITLDGVAYRVVGVLPPGFSYPANAEVWTPLTVRADPHLTFTRPVIGRLKQGVTRDQAQAAFAALATNLTTDDREKLESVAQVTPLKDAVVGDVRRPLSIFMGAVAFVLLIACANVTNLLLMRAVARRQEIATRLALGAGKGRLVRQLMTETALLSLGGGLAGLFVALVGGHALLSLVPTGILPRDAEILADGWVLAFTLAVAVLTAVVLGLVSAFQATRQDLSGTLREGPTAATRQSHRLRHALVVAEMALALVLLVGAGLLVKSFLTLRAVDPGFKPQHVMTMTLDLPAPRYRSAFDLTTFHDRLLASLSPLPDVVSAGAVNWLPLGGMLLRGDIVVEDRRPLPRDYIVTKASISPGYFPAMGIRLLDGRNFTDRDGAKAEGVVVISEQVARLIWPKGDAIGKRISLESNPTPQDWLTIVGIVEDVRQGGLTHNVVPAVYRPYSQVTRPFLLNRMTFVVRTAGDPQKIAPMMRSALRSLDKDLAPQSVATMEEVIAGTIAESQFQTRLLSVFSTLALVLAAIGIYGVLAASVVERRREIGIRMALGADKAAVVGLMMRRTMLLTGIGVILGTAGALAVTKVLAKLLFKVTPTDVATFTIAAGVLVVVAVLAGLLPARQASSVDPLIALRAE